MKRGVRFYSLIIFLSLFGFSIINRAFSAIAFDQASSANLFGGTIIAWPHTVSGTDRLLVVTVVHSNGVNITSMTYGGVNLSQATTVTRAPITVSMWYLTAPNTGTQIVRITFNNFTNIAAGAQSYTGVSQLAPLGIPATNSGIGAAASSVNVISTPGQLVIDAYGASGGAATVGPNQTQRYNLAAGYRMASSTEPGAALVNMSWTHGAVIWALAAVPIVPESVLPIELLSFKVNNSIEGLKIEWKTATEENNDFFTIERSSNGDYFEEIGRIKGAGTSRIIRTYTFLDFQPYEGISYYRLKQTDYDGKSVTFNVVSIFNHERVDEREVVVRKISKNELEGDIFAEYPGLANISIYDVLGKECYSQKIEMQKGINTVNLSLANVPNGIYFLKVHLNGKDKQLVKFVISGNI